MMTREERARVAARLTQMTALEIRACVQTTEHFIGKDAGLFPATEELLELMRAELDRQCPPPRRPTAAPASDATNLTAKEVEGLRGIYASEYDAGSARPSIWDFAVRADLPKASLGGVLASLQKKGLIVCHSAREAGMANGTISVTERGEAVARALRIYVEE